MAVARAYEAEQALELGVEKSYQPIQYIDAAGLRESPTVVAHDRRLGTGGHRVSELSAKDLETMARTAKLQAGRAAVPKASRKQSRAARKFTKEIEDRFGVDASMRIDTRRGVVRVEVKLSDLMED